MHIAYYFRGTNHFKKTTTVTKPYIIILCRIVTQHNYYRNKRVKLYNIFHREPYISKYFPGDRDPPADIVFEMQILIRSSRP